jgi:hypothetical protein
VQGWKKAIQIYCCNYTLNKKGTDPALEAPMLGGATPAIVTKKSLPKTSWHLWNDFTTAAGLSSQLYIGCRIILIFELNVHGIRLIGSYLFYFSLND